MKRGIEWRQTVHILALFLIVQFGGMFLSIYYLLPLQGQLIMQNPQAVSSPTTVFFYAIYIVIAALVIILIMKFYHGDALFRLLEAYVIIAASFFVFYIIIGTYLPQAYANEAILVSLLIGVALVFLKNKKPMLRNTVAVIASIGVGVVLGSNFAFYAAYLLMLIIAVYDYVAVFITRHMITLAKAVATRNLAFLVGSADVEFIPKTQFPAKEAMALQKEVKRMKFKTKEAKGMVKAGYFPVVSQNMLGAGDLGIPLMLAVSAYVTFLSYFILAMLVIGGLVGMLITMYIIRKYRVPLPAIPPIFAGMNLFIGLAFLILGKGVYISGAFFAASALILFVLFITLKRGMFRSMEKM